MYETTPDEDAFKVFRQNAEDISGLPDKGNINYTVWSDVFVCPYCHTEHVFWEQAVDPENGKIRKNYHCPECKADIQKTDCTRATVSHMDNAIGETVVQARQVPVLINYTWGGKRFEKTPDDQDLELIQKIEKSDIPYWFPTNKMMGSGYQWGDTWRRGYHFGITHVHHFYTKRNLWVLSKALEAAKSRAAPMNKILMYTYEQAILGFSKLSRYAPTHYSQVNRYLSGTLYIGSQVSEVSLKYIIKNKIRRLAGVFNILSNNNSQSSFTSLQSANDLVNIKDHTIDYIFTDPPFGDNLMYSELNYLWEAWLKVFTNNQSEAIINNSQNKSLKEYADLMTRSFKECFRILKPNRWITVVFHNSKSHIWNAIQDSLSKAGFVVSNVSVLDKQQRSFKQVTTSLAVSKDLVISAYKPKQVFAQRFLENAGHNLEKDFIAMHLSHLDPEPTIERTEQMLYSRMLSYYVQRGYAIRHNASTFFQMLNDAFLSEDGYWFMPDQVSGYQEYKKKMRLEGISDIATGNLVLFVTDEKSALIWLNAFLETPRTYSDISTAFNKVATTLTDAMPELTTLLEENFVHDNGLYRRPSSDKEKIPLSEKRQRALLKEFDGLLLEASSSRKKIKSCRKEALAAGFEECYKQEKYQDILTLARNLDKKLLENNADLNEFIEVAEIKVEGV
jgi:hypothetical protein